MGRSASSRASCRWSRWRCWCWVNGRYMRQWLQIRMRRWLTAYYQQKWLADRAYYQMQLQPETLGNDNPDQRISEDIRDFVESVLVLGFGLLTNIVSLVSFLQILYMLSFPLSLFGLRIPAYLVWVALGYSVLGTLLAQLIGRPLVSLNFIRQRLEADYRFALVRLRENAEGVALYQGESDEGRILTSRFTAIVANFRRIMSRNRLGQRVHLHLRPGGGDHPVHRRIAAVFRQADLVRHALPRRRRVRGGAGLGLLDGRQLHGAGGLGLHRGTSGDVRPQPGRDAGNCMARASRRWRRRERRSWRTTCGWNCRTGRCCWTRPRSRWPRAARRC